MRLSADCTKRHGSGDKSLHNRFNRLNLINADCIAFLEIEEVANENRLLFVVDSRCIFFELFVTSQTGCNLQRGNSIRIPSVLLSVFTESVLPEMLKRSLGIEVVVESLSVYAQNFFCKFFNIHTSDFRYSSTEVIINHFA